MKNRPDFQRLLRDIELGKIKAIACYKSDRIGCKTADLMRLLEYLERHNVTPLVCSNNINTQNSTPTLINVSAPQSVSSSIAIEADGPPIPVDVTLTFTPSRYPV